MRNRFILIVFMAVLSGLSPPLLWGQECTYDMLIKPNSNHPNKIWCWPKGALITYCYSSYNEPFSSSSADADEAAASWNDNTSISLSSNCGGSDGDIVWIAAKDQWKYYNFADSAIGVTNTYPSDDKKYIVYFDIYLNVAHFPTFNWSGSCESNKLDLSSIMRHEFGHSIGLGDVTCTNTVMDETYARGECHSNINSIDIEAANYLAANSDGDPAASVCGFYVSGGVAHWKVTSEFRTSGYRIDGASSGIGPWEEIAIVPAGVGNRTTAVGGCYSAYRLVELEENGRELIYGMVKPGGGEAPPESETPTAAELKDKLAELGRKRDGKEYLDGRSAAMGEGEEYVIFTADSLIDEVDTYVADYWRGFGYSVVVNSVDGYPSDPDGFRATLRATISSYAVNGTKYFHLIGDANDWQQFSMPWPGGWEQIRQNYLSSGYPPGGQPEKDLIPTWSFPDTLPRDMCVSYYVPYTLTDKPYSDTDDDGVPDVVVTRWPVNTEAEVLALAYKMQSYVDCGMPGTEYSLLTCVGDVDHMELGDGAYARSVADTIIADLPAGQGTAQIYESDYPFDGERNTAVTDLWNEVDPALMLMVSSFSNRSWPANFFVRVGTSNPFHMGMLEDGYPAVVFGLTCDTGDFARTEDPDYGKPVFERFLVEQGKGAIAWVGPTLGSWQRGNEVFGRYFVVELYSDLSSPVAASFLIAQQRVYQDYPDDDGLLKTVDMYAFLGHPLLRLYRETVITAAKVDELPLMVNLGQNYPNPFNPTTVIEFQINYGAYADLVIYDVAGRRIRNLLNRKIDAGIHRIRWDGKNDSGSDVASGIYFYRLTVGELSKTKKIVLLR